MLFVGVLQHNHGLDMRDSGWLSQGLLALVSTRCMLWLTLGLWGLQLYGH